MPELKQSSDYHRCQFTAKHYTQKGSFFSMQENRGKGSLQAVMLQWHSLLENLLICKLAKWATGDWVTNYILIKHDNMIWESILSQLPAMPRRKYIFDYKSLFALWQKDSKKGKYIFLQDKNAGMKHFKSSQIEEQRFPSPWPPFESYSLLNAGSNMHWVRSARIRNLI